MGLFSAFEHTWVGEVVLFLRIGCICIPQTIFALRDSQDIQLAENDSAKNQIQLPEIQVFTVLNSNLSNYTTKYKRRKKEFHKFFMFPSKITKKKSAGIGILKIQSYFHFHNYVHSIVLSKIWGFFF